MSTKTIDASPTKELFIKTLVKDVSLEDAILDLVDNTIDGYIRHDYSERKKVTLNISEEKFEIWDSCGGISTEDAASEVFRFGVIKEKEKHSLGVYGIGLKRSVFKMGSYIVFESDDLKEFFRVIINLDEWQKSEKWELSFEEINKTTNNAFTRISISKLKEDVKTEFKSNRFINELDQRIGRTYFLFMKDNVDIFMNEKKINPLELDIGFSNTIEPAIKTFQSNGVSVRLTAGAHPDYRNPGWYIFCNKRLIISGDKTSLSGWGKRGVPTYHPKFNRFKGFAFFDSDDPRDLPWTTAKNGMDVSSSIFIKALNEMQNLTQQYTSFMSKAYPTDKEETIGKEILGKLETKSIFEFDQDQRFKSPEIPKAPQWTTINYKKLKKDVEKLKKCMGKRFMSNRELGEKTFDYYREMECPDDE